MFCNETDFKFVKTQFIKAWRTTSVFFFDVLFKDILCFFLWQFMKLDSYQHIRFINISDCIGLASEQTSLLHPYIICTEGPRLTRFLGLGKNRVT